MKCTGRNVSTGELMVVEGAALLTHADDLVAPLADPGIWMAPGFIDLQANGFAGVDYNSPTTTVGEIAGSIRALFATGVTRFFPTVITGAPEDMLAALRNLGKARASGATGQAIEAFHVEGPHISPEDGPRGAHPARWVRPPDFDEFQRWQEATEGHVRIVTLAPEWPGAPRYIERIVSEGVVAAIGHTRASREQIRTAVAAGATLSTHLGNGADAAPPKFNYIHEQLAEDRLAASFIVDGHHLTEAFLRVALRAKGIEHSVLITDAVAPAGCAPGAYRLGEVEVELKADSRVVLRDGDRLAGSSLRMDAAIGNVMRAAGLTLIEAMTMATVNAARVGRIGGRMRGLRPGDRSDVVRFRVTNGRIEVLDTYVGGELVFAAPV
jgi:N-acetylglucosamine-6-phosphate deacetylase